AVSQHLRDRELHGGTGGCGEAGSRRIATGSARQVAPLILSSSFPPKRALTLRFIEKKSAQAWSLRAMNWSTKVQSSQANSGAADDGEDPARIGPAGGEDHSRLLRFPPDLAQVSFSCW